MPSLTVPARYYGGIRLIRRLSEQEIDALAKAFEDAPLTSNTTEIRDAITAMLGNWPEGDLRNVIDTIVAISLVRTTSEVAVERFVEDLRRALNDTGEPDLRVGDDDFDSFRRKFTLLLSADRLSLISKATALRSDYENIFCDLKIITEIRPVFGASVDSDPITTLVTHTLKLEYHHGSSHRDLYVALDAADIDSIAKALDRASSKSATLSRLLSSNNIPQFDG